MTAADLRRDLDNVRRAATILPDARSVARRRKAADGIQVAHRRAAGFAWPPPFVIASTGRSGSGYISAVLTAAGIRCGHEGFWTVNHPKAPPADNSLLIDSSWLAIEALPTYHGTVFHQLRHPLDTVASHAIAWPKDGPYWPQKNALLSAPPTGEPWTDSLRFYLDTNAAIAAANPVGTWRVEDVNTRTITDIASYVGISPPLRAIRHALDTTPNNFNAHRANPDRPTWDELADHLRAGPLTTRKTSALLEALRAIAEADGYE